MSALMEAAERSRKRWEREAQSGAGYFAKMVEVGASDAEIAEVVRATAIGKRDSYRRFADDIGSAIARLEAEA